LAAPAERQRVVGLALLEWEYHVLADGAAVAGGDRGRGRKSTLPPFGAVQYSLRDCVFLIGEHILDAGESMDDELRCLTLAEACGDSRLHEGGTVGDFLMKHHSSAFADRLVVDDDVIVERHENGGMALHRLELGARGDASKRLAKVPPQSYIDRWRREAGAARSERAQRPRTPAVQRNAEDDNAILLELPAAKRRRVARKRDNDDESNDDEAALDKIDPVKALMAMGFASYLRQACDFRAAGCAYEDYARGNVAPPEEEDEEAGTHKGTDPRSLARARARFDIVDCLVGRRKMKEWLSKGLVQGICLYSDASPVTGTELQGLVCDVMVEGIGLQRTILPGASMSYGKYDAVNKCIALLHALYLNFAGERQVMKDLLDHVVCITTDFGVEMRTLELPQCVDAFFAWMAGAPLEEVKPLIDWSRRLFPRALRISGWSHARGNLMKQVAKSNPTWPTILEALRELCSFWRSKAWRTHVGKIVGNRFGYDMRLRLRHFRASFAKWRYETIVEVLRGLLPLRELHENALCLEMFGNPQDMTLLLKVLAHAHDGALWLWMEKAFPLFDELEHIRRWGMICGCADCNRIRKTEHRRVACDRNGRRLKEMWDFIKNRIAFFTDMLTNLTEEGCGGPLMYGLVRGMLTTIISLLELRFKYLDTVPWLWAKADEPEAAQRIMDLMASHPLEFHDPFAQDLWLAHQASVAAVAAGCPCPYALWKEVQRMCLASGDESAGEGYHRGTNHEKLRAASSTDASLKRKVREKQVVKNLKGFVAQHGPRAAQVLRFEWQHWKRIIQTRASHKWRGVRSPADKVIARVYREDDMADQDWGSVVTRLPPERRPEKPVPAEGYEQEAAQREWLLATVDKNAVYEVEHPAQQPAPDGGVQEVQKTDIFEVVNVAHAKSRPTLMPTVLLPDAVFMREPIVFSSPVFGPVGPW